LEHVRPEGDGVRARIVSSRTGAAGAWRVHNGQSDTPIEQLPVHAGDTLDFVVDCGDAGNITWDEFAWAPVVRLIEPPAAAPTSAESSDAATPTTWDAAAEFAGQAPSRWATYVQALLLANEFVFVD
jgi:hypothetical protein